MQSRCKTSSSSLFCMFQRIVIETPDYTKVHSCIGYWRSYFILYAPIFSLAAYLPLEFEIEKQRRENAKQCYKDGLLEKSGRKVWEVMEIKHDIVDDIKIEQLQRNWSKTDSRRKWYTGQVSEDERKEDDGKAGESDTQKNLQKNILVFSF